MRATAGAGCLYSWSLRTVKRRTQAQTGEHERDSSVRFKSALGHVLGPILDLWHSKAIIGNANQRSFHQVRHWSGLLRGLPAQEAGIHSTSTARESL